jgi:hypothetical protein
MKSRKTVEFSERFNKHWLGYAAAAGAAGVGLLASPPMARADIVYDSGWSAAVSIVPQGPRTLSVTLSHATWSLNLDGGADIVFKQQVLWSGWPSGHSTRMTMRGYLGSRGNGFAGVSRGEPIGPTLRFQRSATVFLSGLVCERSTCYHFGSNPEYYLGLELTGADGQLHYGWAYFDGFDLLGAAYNPVPGQQILAGQTPTPEPGTLGLLALGSLGLGFWRRQAVTRGEGQGTKDAARAGQ